MPEPVATKGLDETLVEETAKVQLVLRSKVVRTVNLVDGSTTQIVNLVDVLIILTSNPVDGSMLQLLACQVDGSTIPRPRNLPTVSSTTGRDPKDLDLTWPSL